MGFASAFALRATADKSLYRSYALYQRHCDPTGRANARPMTGSANQSNSDKAKKQWIASSLTLLAMTQNCRHSGAGAKRASPESILTIVDMDSGLALRAPRNDELQIHHHVIAFYRHRQRLRDVRPLHHA